MSTYLDTRCSLRSSHHSSKPQTLMHLNFKNITKMKQRLKRMTKMKLRLTRLTSTTRMTKTRRKSYGSHCQWNKMKHPKLRLAVRRNLSLMKRQKPRLRLKLKLKLNWMIYYLSHWIRHKSRNSAWVLDSFLKSTLNKTKLMRSMKKRRRM